jgi:hypothetical protein
VIETSNSILNASLYKEVVPQSLWAWQRVRLANLAAADPPAWSFWFSQYNSGEKVYDTVCADPAF